VSFAADLRHPRPAGPLRVAVSLLLVAAVLAPSLLGRAGFQAIERAVAARIFPLHQHGVTGEAAFIRAYGLPAPFVHPHCHGPTGHTGPESPAEMAAGGLLFGPVLCGSAAAPAAPPVPGLPATDAPSSSAGGLDPRPPLQPPRP
jgi:hypothetical protein